MDRGIEYPGGIPRSVDILGAQQNAMIMGGYLSQMMTGTSVAAIGLACAPTAPASMVVNIGSGAITGFTEIDQTAYGSLGTNTNPLIKIGINQAATSFTLTAPGTSGQSINYLIEAQFQEADGTAIVLPYYNAANPAQPYAGPGNSGTAQNTVRVQTVGLQLLAGAAATTGTQTTPGVTSGWSPLYVITVNYGQTTVTSGAISNAISAPFVGGGSVMVGRLLAVQTFASSGSYTTTTGTRALVAYVIGGGGGSAGIATAASGFFSLSAGGASGAMAWGALNVSALGTLPATVTVGAAGSAGAINSAGGTGGTSSFGGMTAAGGIGSSPYGPTSQAVFITPTVGDSSPATASGGSILNVNGNPGAFSIGGANTSPTGSAFAVGGAGGVSPIGGSSKGAGGHGAAQTGGAGVVGNNGGVGAVIIFEFS